MTDKTQLLVIGGGPGGYTAAFRAADLGLAVTLVERDPVLGGVCLNVGCIPSKALLHVAEVVQGAADANQFGLTYAKPKQDLTKMRQWKDGIVSTLTGGLAGLAKKRKVTRVQGSARFEGPNRVRIETGKKHQSLEFEQVIIAVGSEPTALPGLTYGGRIMDSTAALTLEDIPKRLLIVGGGIIGLEMAAIYHALGSEITVIELGGQLLPGVDPDLVRVLEGVIKKRYAGIHLNTQVSKLTPKGKQVRAEFAGDKPQTFDRALIAVGRKPNGAMISAEAAGVAVDKQGFIAVDEQQRTNQPHIFAIGDVVGQPMLAHKAVHEGRVAAEVAAGKKSGFEARVIPSVAYTQPEVAWVGLTETAAKQQGIAYETGIFPWAASGRSLSQGEGRGITKLLFDPNTEQLLGAGICGAQAGELIAEATLAIEMQTSAHDLGLTIHPHPTLAETLGLAAEVFAGTATDLYAPKKP